MLKGKKGLYILLPLVVFIWGAIIYQVVDAFSDDDPIMHHNTNIQFDKIETKEREAFSISEVQRDPFLGKVYKPPKKASVAKRITKDTIQWPSIEYKGSISSKNKSNTIYLIEINGSEELMKLHSSSNGVKLIKANKDKVTIRYKGRTKIINVNH